MNIRIDLIKQFRVRRRWRIGSTERHDIYLPNRLNSYYLMCTWCGRKMFHHCDKTSAEYWRRAHINKRNLHPCDGHHPKEGLTK